MSRRGYTESYERDYYSGPRERDYEEIDIVRRRDPVLPVAKVSREREYEEIDLIRRREPDPPPPRPSREREYEEIDLIRRREPDPPPARPSRDRGYEEIDIVRRREADRPPPARPSREAQYEELEFIRRREPSPQPAPSRAREREYEEIDIIRRREPEPKPKPKPKPARTREADYDEIDIIRRRRSEPDISNPPPRPRERERERERDRGRDYEEIDIVRRREHTPERPKRQTQTLERDYDEIDIIRRREPRQREREPPEFLRDNYGKTESQTLVVREREREIERFAPVPTPRRSPSREPEREVVREPVIIREPVIHQEIVTHHRHIDHGIERLPPPSPARLPSPSPRRTVEKEVEIEKRTTRGGRDTYEDEIFFERKVSRDDDTDDRPRRGRSADRSLARPDFDADVASEAEYYNRRAEERAYIGEGYNGATRDWTIVDVPPGTQRVTLDGIGGASEEITWQRYNGVRRSNFIPEREQEATETRVDRPNRRFVADRDDNSDMWTEITKDLVVREAIETIGYEFDETEYFFYIMDYLRYDDVLELVELSQDIRRDRHERIRAIQWERDQIPERRERRPMIEEERFVEREVVYEGRRPPPRYLRQ